MFRLLDLFCGAGGAAMGYHHAGFSEIVGVDIRPQPRYPFKFVQADALEFVREHGAEFDAIHASPPCQAYTILQNSTKNRDKYPDLVAATRELLRLSNKPYVIENVKGAPLKNPIELCGTFFNLRVYRHRLFETSFFMLMPPHNSHRDSARNKGISPAGYVCVTGNGGMGMGKGGWAYAQKAMGIDWMNRAELSQAIPPAYTEYIGQALLNHMATQHSVQATRSADGSG
jgi:DNA (cytosine-5)-methyltransferase 1